MDDGSLRHLRTEAQAYAKYILQTRPEAKIGLLYANDHPGNAFVAGLRDGFGEKAAAMIVKQAAFKYSDPATVDRQVEALRDTGADVFINAAIGRSATQAIRKAFDIGWHPTQFIPNANLSVAAFLDPAGLEKANGIISNARSKFPAPAQAQTDPAVSAYLDWMRRYNTDASIRDQLNLAGYERAQVLKQVLTKCGDELTRAQVMKQAASLDLEIGMLQPGIRVTTSPTDYQPIKQLFLVRFSGKDWISIGAQAAR